MNKNQESGAPFADFELLDHTGDIRIRVKSTTLPGLFVAAAEAMMTLLFGREPQTEGTGRTYTLQVQAEDRESLLVNWLSEQLFLTQTEYALARNISVSFIGDREIKAHQELIPAAAIEDIKAVTYHNLVLKEENGLFTAEVTFDI